MYGCSIFSNSSVALPRLWASIGVTRSYSSRPFLTDDNCYVELLKLLFIIFFSDWYNKFVADMVSPSHIKLFTVYEVRFSPIICTLCECKDGFQMSIKRSTSGGQMCKCTIKRQLYSGPFTLREAAFFLFRY